MQAGTILSKDDLSVARVLSTGRPATGFDALRGTQDSGRDDARELIYRRADGGERAGQDGQGAILTIRDGPVALTADVIARTGGGMGEPVTVYNAQTNKILSGVVTGPDRKSNSMLPGGDAE